MKIILLIASHTCIVSLSSLHGNIEIDVAHPFPIETPLATARLNGYLTASNQYFTASFNVAAIEVIFYSKKHKMTVVSLSGSLMLDKSRTNIIIYDTVMEYEEVLALIETERSKLKT